MTGVKLMDFGGSSLTGSRLLVGCESGWQPVPDSSEVVSCANSSNESESEVEWRSRISCTRSFCPIRPTDPHGFFECNGEEHSVLDDVCMLLCFEGFQLRGGYGKFRCRPPFFVGSGACSQTWCPAADWKSVPFATRTSGNCSGRMRHGQTCGVLCQDGFAPLGAFRCTFGEYGQRPLCSASGTSYREDLAVKGVLLASLWAADGESLERDLRAGIAQGSDSSLSDVTIVQISDITEPSDATRRLQESRELRIIYKVGVADRGRVLALVEDIVAGFRGRFLGELLEALRRGGHGVSAGGLWLQHPWEVSEWAVQEHAALSPDATSLGLLLGVAIGGSMACAFLGFLGTGLFKSK